MREGKYYRDEQWQWLEEAQLGECLKRWLSGAGSGGLALERLGWSARMSEDSWIVWRRGEAWLDLEAVARWALSETVWRYRLGSGKLSLEWRRVWQWWRYGASVQVWRGWWRWQVDPPEAVTLVEALVRQIPEPGLGEAGAELVLARKVWPVVIVVELVTALMCTWVMASLSKEQQASWREYFAREARRPAGQSELDVARLGVSDKVRRQMMAAVELEWWRQEAWQRVREHVEVLQGWRGGGREDEKTPAEAGVKNKSN